MFISQEAAIAAAKSRHKLRTVKEGTGCVICPYVPGACFSTGHFVPPPVKRWLQCQGDMCQWHHLPPIVKAHVPALVCLTLVKPEKCELLKFDPVLPFRPANWVQKIFELTAGVLEDFNRDSRPDQLAVVWRNPGQANGPLHFKWLDTVLTGVPESIAHFHIKEMLPAIIHGEVVTDNDPIPLDKNVKGRIKHNSPSPTHKVDERLENFFQAMSGGKGGAK